MVRSEAGQGEAVLFSGGLDSAVLLAAVAAESRQHRTEAQLTRVVPIYVRVGLAWERDERTIVERLLSSEPFRDVQPIVTLTVDMKDVYPPTHWAIRGEAPGFDTPDEDVYLEGRNLVLLSKAAVFMARTQLTRISIGPLAGNPFPDATPEFFATMGRAVSLGLGTSLDIAAPFLGLHKADVINLGLSLGVPLELTLSCMQPTRGRHCGQCSKCRERRDAFREAGAADSTEYVVAPLR